MTLWYQFLGEPVHVTVHGFFPSVHLCAGWRPLSSFLADVTGLWTTLCIIVRYHCITIILNVFIW